jgi:hypothetical protein
MMILLERLSQLFVQECIDTSIVGLSMRLICFLMWELHNSNSSI